MLVAENVGTESALIWRAVAPTPKPISVSWGLPLTSQEPLPGSAMTEIIGVTLVTVRRSSAKSVTVN